MQIATCNTVANTLFRFSLNKYNCKAFASLKIWQTRARFFSFVLSLCFVYRCPFCCCSYRGINYSQLVLEMQKRPKATVFDISHPIKYRIQNIIRLFSRC